MLLPEQPAGVLTWSNDDDGGNSDRFWVIPSAIDFPYANPNQKPSQNLPPFSTDTKEN